MIWNQIILALISCALGLPQAIDEAQNSESKVPTASHILGRYRDGPRNFAKVPPPKFKSVMYGPSFGITPEGTTAGYLFDDKYLLTRGLGSGEMRSLQVINCFHMNPDNYFIGLMEMYSSPAGDQQISYYHGWTPVVSMRAKANVYKLKPGESWAFVTYKACGGKLVGIHFGTDMKGGGVACGDYHYNGPNPRYIHHSIKCTGAVLFPDPGQKIVGLYGEANGLWFTKNQGVLGIGLLTVKI